jgi:hypothetical protein
MSFILISRTVDDTPQGYELQLNLSDDILCTFSVLHFLENHSVVF